MPGPTGRRELIVDSAFELITGRGYDATSIGDIAAALDVSKAAIAYYFPTKDLFLAEFATPFLDELEAATSGQETAAAVLGAYLRVITEHHDIAVWFDTEPAIQRDPDLRGRFDRINADVIDTLTGGADAPAEMARATAALGGVWRPARMLALDELQACASEIVETALAGSSP